MDCYKNIMIDGRVLTKTGTGIYTFFRDAIISWAKEHKDIMFYIFVPKQNEKSNDPVVFPSNVIILRPRLKIPHFLPNLIVLFLYMPFLIRRYKISYYYSPVPCIPFFLPKRIKTMITVHDVVNIEYKDTMQWNNKLANMFIFDRSVKNADKIWTNSKYTKSKVEQYFPNRRSKDIIVGDAANRDLFRKLDIEEGKRLSLLSKFGIKDRFLLFVGTMEPRKNLQFLLSIIPEVYRQTGRQLVVVGAKGWKQSKSIYDLVSSEGFPRESVVFCGFVSNEELVKLYNLAECFISASLNEGFGMPQLEAALCGCPVITANNSAMSEVMHNKKGTLLIDGYDKDCWIKKIVDFINNKQSIDINEFEEYDWNQIMNLVHDAFID